MEYGEEEFESLCCGRGSATTADGRGATPAFVNTGPAAPPPKSPPPKPSLSPLLLLLLPPALLVLLLLSLMLL